MPPWSPTLGRLLILLLHEVGVESQPPKPPSPAPLDPALFIDLLLLQVGVGERGRGSLWRKPLGHMPYGWTDLMDPQAGLGQVWEAREGLWALVWAKSEDLSKTGLNP